MVYDFTLCPECFEKYRVLRFDAACNYWLCPMPFCCIAWADEHPDNSPPTARHPACRDSIIRLSNARKALWLSGQVPEELQQLWEQAQRVIPDWPGFQRLKINRKQRCSLDHCVEELEHLTGAIRRDYPNIQGFDKGGTLTGFVASRDGAPGQRPWWKFW